MCRCYYSNNNWNYLGIIESLTFKEVSIKDFLTDTQWTPLFAKNILGSYC